MSARIPASPPPVAFQVVWPILYACLGVALGLLATMPSRRTTKAVQWTAFALLAAQLALNYAWTPLFTGGKKDTALIVLVVMLMVTLAGLALATQGQVISAALVSPYAAWLVFALVLSAQDFLPNKPGTPGFASTGATSR